MVRPIILAIRRSLVLLTGFAIVQITTVPAKISTATVHEAVIVRCSAAFTGLADSMTRTVAASIATEPGSSASCTPFQTHGSPVNSINKALIYIVRERVSIIEGHIDTKDGIVIANDGIVIAKDGVVITKEGNIGTRMPLAMLRTGSRRFRRTSALCTTSCVPRLQDLAPLISYL